jgi:DHA1 family tetracycline resistance protein-like MFS transporter
MNRRSIPPHIFIYITAFLETAGGGLGRPVLPRLLQEITGKDVAHVGTSLGLLITVYAVALLATSKLLGLLSDTYGRRPVILLALLGSAIDYIAAATVTSFWVLLVIHVVAGFCGATLVVCNAYIVDVTPPEQRAVRFGMLKGVLAAGLTLGPVIGGVLGAHSIRTPFWMAAIVTGVSGLYGFLLLPETLKKADRRPFSWKGAVPFYVPKLSGVSIPLGVLLTLFLFELGASLSQPITALYTQLRFAWTPANLGVFFGLGGLLSIGGQAGLTRLIVPRIGDRRAVTFGLSVFSFTLMLYGLAQASWHMYAIMLIAQFGFIGIPALMSLTSNYANSAAQGELFGLLVAVSISAEIGGPLLGSWLFTEFSMRNGQIFLPGLPYFAGAAVLAASLVAARMSGLLTPLAEKPSEPLPVASSSASTSTPTSASAS